MRRNTFSRTSREIEALLDHLDELVSHGSDTPATTLRKIIPFYIAQVPMICLCLVRLLTPRARRVPCRSRAGPPSNLGVELKANASTFEYERHRACLSVKTSTDEPSHVPLHARTLRGAALSS